jgi:hypothetical protein
LKKGGGCRWFAVQKWMIKKGAGCAPGQEIFIRGDYTVKLKILKLSKV